MFAQKTSEYKKKKEEIIENRERGAVKSNVLRMLPRLVHDELQCLRKCCLAALDVFAFPP